MNIGICGLGVMGRNHLRCATELGFNITTTYDPYDKRIAYNEFLRSLTKCDGVIVSSPTNCHIKNIHDILKINPNIFILCEKPFTINFDEDILKQIIPFKNQILVGQVERFNPLVTFLKENIVPQNVKQIKTLRVNNTPAREPIDCKLDIGIHDFDISVYLINNFPKNINLLSLEQNYYKNHEIISYKIKDIIVINEVSWLYPYKKRTIELLLDNGVYIGSMFDQTLQFIDWSNNTKNIVIEKQEPLKLELLHFKEMILGNTKPISNIETSIKLVKYLLNYEHK